MGYHYSEVPANPSSPFSVLYICHRNALSHSTSPLLHPDQKMFTLSVMPCRNWQKYCETKHQPELHHLWCSSNANGQVVQVVKRFSGYHGYDRCTQKGFWDIQLIYPDLDNLDLRIDDSLKQCWQPEHLQEEQISPFPLVMSLWYGW